VNYFVETVLLVDDNEIDNFLSAKIIQENSFARHIIAKQSSDDALEYLFNEYKINKKIPGLIFLDIRMPVSDGFYFLESFETFHEALKSKTKIVILTSSLDDEDIRKANENNLVLFLLNKPFSSKALEDLKRKLKADG